MTCNATGRYRPTRGPDPGAPAGVEAHRGTQQKPYRDEGAHVMFGWRKRRSSGEEDAGLLDAAASAVVRECRSDDVDYDDLRALVDATQGTRGGLR